jgi:hypothetical protein
MRREDGFWFARYSMEARQAASSRKMCGITSASEDLYFAKKFQREGRR